MADITLRQVGALNSLDYKLYFGKIPLILNFGPIKYKGSAVFIHINF
jgi:hypothetical protein